MAEYRSVDLPKLVKKRKLAWPALFRGLPNIKTNGRLRFLKIGEEPDFFKHYELYKVQPLEVSLVQMDALSLNYWLTKFIQEVAKPSKDPPEFSMQILCRSTSFHQGKE